MFHCVLKWQSRTSRWACYITLYVNMFDGSSLHSTHSWKTKKKKKSCSKWKYLVTENDVRVGAVYWCWVEVCVCVYITWRTDSEKVWVIFKCKANEKWYDSSVCSFFTPVIINFSPALMMLYVTMYCGLQLSFWNRPVGCFRSRLSELIWAFYIQVVSSYTRGDELGSADTNSPEGSYCLRCRSAWEK